MKTVKVNYGGFSAEQGVEENLYNAIFKQGRDDANREHAATCETCVHKVSAEDIEQIRAAAIDECIKIISEMQTTAEANMMWEYAKACDLILKQIKEGKT